MILEFLSNGSNFIANAFQYQHSQITRQKTHNLFRADDNSLEQCCAAHIVQCCQQYCSALSQITIDQMSIFAKYLLQVFDMLTRADERFPPCS